MTTTTIFSERNSSKVFIPKWTAIEHTERYWFANQFLQDKVVLDCACGTGLGTKVYSQADAAKIFAYDISDAAVSEARENCHGSAVEFAQASATNLPLKDESVDVYVSFETIEHITDDKAYLAEALRVLRSGGLFVCSTPNRSVTNPGAVLSDAPINPFHVREYSESEFLQLLGTYLTVIETYGQNRKPKLLLHTINWLAKFLPHPIPARLHQVFKVCWYFLGFSHKTGVEKVADKQETDFEFLVGVCRKA